MISIPLVIWRDEKGNIIVLPSESVYLSQGGIERLKALGYEIDTTRNTSLTDYILVHNGKDCKVDRALVP